MRMGLWFVELLWRSCRSSAVLGSKFGIWDLDPLSTTTSAVAWQTPHSKGVAYGKVRPLSSVHRNQRLLYCRCTRPEISCITNSTATSPAFRFHMHGRNRSDPVSANPISGPTSQIQFPSQQKHGTRLPSRVCVAHSINDLLYCGEARADDNDRLRDAIAAEQFRRWMTTLMMGSTT